MICHTDKRCVNRLLPGLLAAAFAAMLLGCGPYSFSSSGATHIKSVAVPVFQNRTSEFGINEQLTNRIIDEFTRDNTLSITDRRRADSYIEGAVVNVREEAGSFTSDEAVQDIRIFVTVTIKYEDLVKRKVVWEERITQWGIYDPDDAADSREQGIDRAIQKIATEVLNKSTSGW